MKSFEWLVSSRYVFSKKRINLITVISSISIIGVTTGVAALIVVLSVFNGFLSLVEGLLKGVDPDIRIESSDRNSLSESDSLLFSILVKRSDIELYSKYIEGKTILSFENKNQVSYLHGIDTVKFGQMTKVQNHVVMGRYSFSSTDSSVQNGLVMGVGLGDKLGVSTGATIAAISPVGLEKVFTQMTAPRVKRFKVNAVFSIQKAFDTGVAYADYSVVQDLFKLGGKMTGIEIRLKKDADAEKVKSELQKALGEKYWVQSWYDLRREMYTVMRLEKWGAYIILTLIIVVAAFNIVGTLLMTVLEKKRDIGILRSMGASKDQVYSIFLKQGLIVGVSGVIAGSIIGYGIVFLQMKFGFYKIPNAESFIIDSFPVTAEWTDFFAVTSVALILTVLSAIYPAKKASELNPVENIRWE